MTPKVVVNALVVLVGLVLAAVVSATDAHGPLSIAAAVAAAVAVPLGARDALVTVFGLLPEAWRREIVMLSSVLLTAGATINAAVVQPPPALTVGIAVLVAVSTGLGVRSQVAPLVTATSLGRSQR